MDKKDINAFLVGGSDRFDRSSEGFLRYQQIPEDRFQDFIPVRKNPQWGGAPLKLEDVKVHLQRCQKMAAFDSLDFDPVDSDLERERDVSRCQCDYYLIHFWKWFLSLMIGVVMGVIAFMVGWGIESLNNAKYGLVYSLIHPNASPIPAFCAYLGITLAFALAAASLVSFLSPLAAGSGIPELKTFLNGIQIRGLLKIKTLVAKLVGVMFSIACGLIAGKEGPFIHGGGIVGGGIAQMGSKTLRIKLPTKWGGYFRGSAEHRDFVAIGTAAGVAVAFSAPIGGLLFTIEEGASFYSVSIFWRGFLATCVGVATLRFLAVVKDPHHSDVLQKLGVNRDFGLYSDVLADYGKVYHFYLWEIPVFILMGICGGLLGGGFVWMNIRVTRFRSKYIPVSASVRRLVEVLVVAGVTAIIFFFSTYLSPCQHKPPPQVVEKINVVSQPPSIRQNENYYQWGGMTDHFPQLWCEEGRFSPLGQLMFVPLATSLRLIIHMGERLQEENQWDFEVAPLLLYFIVVYLLMTVTYGVGAPTGLFVPSLSVGAACGRIIGQFMKQIGSQLGWSVAISVPSYAIVGAAASLGGATRMTLSITVLVMETTGALQLITPLMITVFFAKITGDFFSTGIYDTHIQLRGTPLLEEHQLDAHQRMLSDKLQVGDICESRVVAIIPAPSLRMVVDMLNGCTHGTIPITQDLKYKLGEPPVANTQFALEGVVQRIQLLKIIKFKIGFKKMEDLGVAEDYIPETKEDVEDLLFQLDNLPLKTHLSEQSEILSTLCEWDLDEYFIDLHPFMRRYPYVIHEQAPVSRAYRLFRTMGLRQLFISTAPVVKGVVTRKDLIDDNLMLVMGEKAHQGTIEITKEQKKRLLKHQNSQMPILHFDHYHTTGEHEEAYNKILAHSFKRQSIQAEIIAAADTIATPQPQQEHEQLDDINPNSTKPLLPK